MRDQDILLLETRSALRAVQSACERHRNVRTLLLLDNLALVLLLTKGQTRSFLVLAVIRRVFGIANSANCNLVFRWVQFEVHHSDRGSRFYRAEYDLSECLLNRLRALQRQTMSSHSPHQAPSSSHVSTSPCHHATVSYRPGHHCRNTSLSCATNHCVNYRSSISCCSNTCFLCYSELCVSG